MSTRFPPPPVAPDLSWLSPEELAAVLSPQEEWRPILPSRFQMGSPEDEPGRLEWEGPRHEVELTRPFMLLATPLTQRQWERLMGNQPSGFKDPDRPVENVTWYDAVAWCNARSRLMGLEEAYVLEGALGVPGEGSFRATVHWRGPDHPGVRLPTEAEWEYACRAGSQAARYGDLDEVAWHFGNSGGETHPVGFKTPNRWRLHDMLGNIWEWCWDRWQDRYPGGRRVDPLGPEPSSHSGPAVVRGGAWNFGSRRCRAALRDRIRLSYRFDSQGFRPARTIP